MDIRSWGWPCYWLNLLGYKICTQCGGTSYNQPCYPGGGEMPHWYSFKDELRDSLSALVERVAVLERGDRPHYQPLSEKKVEQKRGGTPLG